MAGSHRQVTYAMTLFTPETKTPTDLSPYRLHAPCTTLTLDTVETLVLLMMLMPERPNTAILAIYALRFGQGVLNDPIRNGTGSYPKGSMYLYSRYLGLKGVPTKVL